MRKGFLSFLILILTAAVIPGTVLAEYGYTSVSRIPMAVDFSFRVDFDDAGLPHIVTDYPFEKTGANEMNLVYNQDGREEVLTLNYQYSTGVTRIGSWAADLSAAENPEDAYRAIRSGKIVPDDSVYINTSHFGSETDWVLVYSAGQKQYVEYSERTQAQAFNAMGAGGTERSIYYHAGEIDSSRVLNRAENADLAMYYDRSGEVTFGSVTSYSPEFRSYDYDPATGLFGGRPVTELGFDETALSMPPLAAVGERQETGGDLVTMTGTEDAVVRTGGRSPVVTIVGGLLAGIMIGITIFYCFRRKNKEEHQTNPSESENRKHDSQNDTDGSGSYPAEAGRQYFGGNAQGH